MREPLNGAEPCDLLGVPASGWRDVLSGRVDAPYRADQLANWVFRHGVFSYERMHNLPVGVRSSVLDRFSVTPPPVEQVFTSVDRTRRYLLEADDGRLVEAVFMPYGDRSTLCISSQIGCRFACDFCQTGVMGLHRSLTAGEIVGQVVRLRADTGTLDRSVNVVFMGQGEPLDNAASVCAAVEALLDSRGPALSWRRITVSTVGVVPQIERLNALGDRRPRLAVSLNATNDEVRSRLMPINRKWPITALLGALRRIRWRPRERVTLEYVLLAGINDLPEDARRLARLLRDLPAKVNLIPWNPLPDMPFRRPSPEAVEGFRRAVRSSGLDTLVRYSRGADIAAACGQLHARSVVASVSH